jgi:integrase|tara:strand:- start:3441 stop:4346 length:906 start_codon:yes stop_codon:yes gene_type:complete
MPHFKIKDLVQEYYKSSDYNVLSDKSKVDYKNFINVMLTTKVDNKELGEHLAKRFAGAKARRAYEQWLLRGVQMANHICAVSRKLYSFGMEMGYSETNPFATFKRKTVKPRKVVWEREQIVKFLDEAYSDFNTRNIGLIVQMSYEWCQRIGDMRTLTFDCLDLNNQVLNLEQSKRGATVHLPISDGLTEMLKEQQNDFDFQKYVAPFPRPKAGEYMPYELVQLSMAARVIMRRIGLPENLRIADLRRTGTTEMVEAGVSMGQIMSVTGHSNPSSVKPYMKNTYTSAESALTARKNHVTSTL